MQIHLLSVTSYALHAQKKRGKKDAVHTKKAVHNFCMKIESIKARCAPIVYIMLQRTCRTKRPMRMTR